MSKKRVWTTEGLVEYVGKIDSAIEVIGEYVNTQTNIECKCKECNYIWFPKAGNLINKKSHCPKCSQHKKSVNSRMNFDTFCQKVYSINPDVEILGEYSSTKKHIKCRCKKCGKIWSPIAEHLLRGGGCATCSYKENGEKRKLTQEEFTLKLAEINPGIEVLGIYKGAYKPIKCKCLKCGNVWHPIPHNILSSRGCPQCSHSATSFIEQLILKCFQKVLGDENVLSRDKSAIGKELDIFIPSLGLAFEPGAWDLHKYRLEKDKEKKKLCEKNNIRLITIYYGCSENIDSNDDMRIYSQNYVGEAEFNDLKNLIYELFTIANIKHAFSSDDWFSLKKEAYLSSRKITNEEFIAKLNEINPNILVLGEYTTSQQKMKCQCKICGHIWSPRANGLIQKRGCPKCKGKNNTERLKFSHEQFLTKLQSINPNIKVLEQYIDISTKIKFRCCTCGYEWETRPSVLLTGHGCPNCAGRPKITTETFCIRMKDINPNIEVIGEYINTSTKIECICKTCNNEWSARPHDLLSGSGCPECGRLKKGNRKKN